ncbi:MULTISPECIES: glutaminyl-peptide cyclotransferase [Corynebacterium]|uniref:Glutaminyl-peptide cyclotransferase n=1 Tax=Corynebacterium amycolatum TaxID=43765 RepID=A0AB38XW75_CORAY|nr:MULTISPECIES: glutaminyl-peptide cyclotransferase [Corynebacterium]AIN82918.1 glutamine cyclotransferase family protein [Corynebacterium sp. ATCC 6931]MBC6725519.1 glutamine cyclotransferase [Corynebacterium amycolatum]MDY7341743.1 glutaminyl-peptide cyclotransferase [Corynebacterium amycolatum]OFU57502.1 glutamine cyclotransferase [Corynebacterium sp. HMSC11H10]QRP17449.1 glutaminyl-peptide cyclotransferase [Corynebacterium amycolatum]
MDRFPSGDAKPARPFHSSRFTTARAAILSVATAVLLAGCATETGSGSNSSGEAPASGASAGSNSGTAGRSTSASVNPSELVGADTVPGLGDVPTLKLTIEQYYPISAPPLPASKNVTAPFVQGLEFEPDGSLLMGTGLYGESQIYRLPQWLDNPAVEPTNVEDLQPELFGEGLTRHGDTVWQLTWKEGRALERDAATLKQRREVPFDAEGWGACSFDDTIVTSDGSGTLTFRSPDDLSSLRQLPVTAAGTETTWLNELECVTVDTDVNPEAAPDEAPADTSDSNSQSNTDGPTSPQSHREIWANVWQSPFIYRINPEDGKVTGIVDATELFRDLHAQLSPAARNSIDVLNGIALMPDSSSTSPNGTRQFLLTGKKWPTAYRVTVSE